MEKNEFRLDREEFVSEKTVTEQTFEHPMEKDFVLPDYCPDIFKVLKCFVKPVITSRGINGSRLTYDGEVKIRVIYSSENSAGINCIEQSVTFSKTAELEGECINPEVTIIPTCEYVNCRVVNQRRIDIRGAVSAAVRVVCEEPMKCICSAFGGGIQLKKQLCTLPVKRICAAKKITLVEEAELGEAKPPVGTIIDCGCKVSGQSMKIIAGKLVAKGEALVNVLYTCAENDGSLCAENIQFSLPFSHIIDMEGIDETFSADVVINCAGCEILPKGESGRSLECSLTLLVNCTAIKYVKKEIVSDAFSTDYQCEISTSVKKLSGKGIGTQKDCTVNCEEVCCDGKIGRIYHCSAQVQNIFSSMADDKKTFTVTGNILVGILGCDSENLPFYHECQKTFEEKIPVPENEESTGFVFLPLSEIKNVSYIITGENALDIKCGFEIKGNIFPVREQEIIDSITIDTEKPCERKDNYALRLCRVSQSDDIWALAKKYSASVRAIEEENGIDDENIPENTMLIIPLTK